MKTFEEFESVNEVMGKKYLDNYIIDGDSIIFIEKDEKKAQKMVDWVNKLNSNKNNGRKAKITNRGVSIDLFTIISYFVNNHFG